MYEQQLFGYRLPTLHEFIPAISKALDQQFGGRHRLVENKRIKYFHKERIMNNALEEASWDMNPIGMKLFFENINLYELRLSFMEMLDNGTVREKYNSGTKSYTSDGQECSCSYFAQNMFCRHLIFYRLSHFLPVYDAEAIHPSLMKSAARTDIRQKNPDAEPEDIDDLSPPSPGLEMVIEKERQKRKAPKQSQKFNLGWDVGKEMVEILSLQDSRRFESYLKSTKDFVHLLRQGLPESLQKLLSNPEMFEIVHC